MITVAIVTALICSTTKCRTWFLHQQHDDEILRLNFFQFTQRQVNALASPLNLSLVAVWFIGISWQFPAHIPTLLTIVHLHRLYWCCCCRVASSSSFYPQRDQRRVLMQVSQCFIYAHNCTVRAFLWAPDRFNALLDAKFSSGDFPFVVLLGWMAKAEIYCN